MRDGSDIRHHVEGLGAQFVQGRMALDLSDQRAGEIIIHGLVAFEEIDASRVLFLFVQEPNLPAQARNRGKGFGISR